MRKEPIYRAVLKDPLKYRWLIFTVAGLVYFMTCFHRVSTSVIAHDLASAFNIDATILGLIASSYFYLYSAIQPPVGVLSDTIGPRRVVTFFTVVACIGGIVFGTAANPAMAIVGRGLIGMGAGGIFIPTLKIFSRWYRGNEFASLTGLLMAIGYLGAIFASLPLTYMVLLIGWRLSFVGLGLFSLVLAAGFWGIARDKPGDKGWTDFAGGLIPPPQPADIMPENMTMPKRFKLVVLNKDFWMITVSIFFVGGAGLTFSGLWAVPFLVDIYQLSRVEASSFLMLSLFGVCVGAVGFGFLSDKLGIDKKRLIFISLLLGLFYWAAFCFIGTSIPTFVFIPIFFIMGVTGGGTIPLYMTITKELFPDWLIGTAMGLMNPAAFFATALFQPFSGFLMDRVGKSSHDAYSFEAYQNVFILFLISYAISLTAMLFLKAPTVKH
ncbi:MAG: MFS transporter [Proteobacteria bacterium]|nr:MFS transporter [Pseudomonadota bacterium]